MTWTSTPKWTEHHEQQARLNLINIFHHFIVRLGFFTAIQYKNIFSLLNMQSFQINSNKVSKNSNKDTIIQEKYYNSLKKEGSTTSI